MKNKSIEDFEDDGFEIYHPREKNKRFENKAKPSAPVATNDNSDILKAIGESNLTQQRSSEMTAKSFQHGIERLVKALADKPDSFTLDIERDERGFMKKVNVTINK